MEDGMDIWKLCPELAVELAKLEIELIFQEFEDRFFRLLGRIVEE